MRTALRLVLGLVLLGALLGCSGGGPVTPGAGPTAGGAQPAPAASPTPAGPLPAVLAELSFSLPGGDAYRPQALALDERGQAVVLCEAYGEEASTSALALVDPAQGARGRLIPLPGRSFGPLAVGGGRAYVGYEDRAYRRRLAAVDLESGQVTAEVASEGLYPTNPLVATPGGRLYLPQGRQLQVRDGATLQVVQTLEFDAAVDRALAADLGRDRVYLAVGEWLRAYRASDLTLLWEAEGLAGSTSLVADQAGEHIYAQCESFEGGDLVVQLLAFDAQDGRALGPVSVDQQPGLQLVAADSAAGRLVFTRSGSEGMRLWQAGLDGRPTGAEAPLPGLTSRCVAGDGRLLTLALDDHVVLVFDLASLALVHEVPLGVELRHVVADASHERVYANDSAGRVHAIDTRTYQVLASVPAGRGELALDAANGLLFAGRETWGHEVSVLSTEPLAVIAAISGGYRVAVDSAGRRAFVGWTEMGDPTPGEVQVWDTRTFERVGVIAHRGEPAYNPLRDEVYLQDYTAYVVDGQSLEVIGELTPDIGQTPPGMQGCDGCESVAHIAVEPALDAVVLSLQTYANGPGTVPQARLFSARTLEPVTHTVTVLPRAYGGPGLLILPPDEGRVYEAQQYRRSVVYNATLAYPAGADAPAEAREGLPLTLYLPGEGVGLSAQEDRLLAFDTTRWQPLGWLPFYGIGEVDLASRRLYTWQQAQLTVLAFDGGQPQPPTPAEPWTPADSSVPAVQSIVLSPDYAHDRTVFMVAGGEILRSTDGGETWLRLRGDLPPSARGIVASYSLALSPAYGEDHTLFAGGRLGDPLGYGVWRSTDGGDTWAPAWQGLEHLRVDRVVTSPGYGEDQTLLAYCEYSEFWRAELGTTLFRSTDGGRSWVRLETRTSGDYTPLPAPEALLPCPAEPVQFRVSERGDAVERSMDGGESWAEVLRRADPAERPLAVARSPFYGEDRQVFVLFGDRLYRSCDGGDSWQTVSDPTLVRSGYPQHYTAMAVGEGVGGGVALLVGDQSGAVRVLDPSALPWAPAAAATPTAVPGPQAGPTPCRPPAAPVAAAYPTWAGRLGCPLDAGVEVQMAVQPFERGVMLWRGDTREVYVLARDGANSWTSYPDTWQEGLPDRDPALQPPAGRQQPVRGFGLVWREQLGGLGAAVGWALEAEESYGGTWQSFAGGWLVTGPDGRVYALFADGSWE